MGRVLETSAGNARGWAGANLAERERYSQRVSQIYLALKPANILWRLELFSGLGGAHRTRRGLRLKQYRRRPREDPRDVLQRHLYRVQTIFTTSSVEGYLVGVDQQALSEPARYDVAARI